MPKKKKSIPASPLQDLPWPLSLEQDLANVLVTSEKRFQSDRSNSLPAFEALSYIAAYVWQKGESPTHALPIPWWVIEVLAVGFGKYCDSARSITPMTLGEAYALEGGGQGNERRIQRELRDLCDIRIASAIAFADADGAKLDAVLQDQAVKTGLSVGQVRRIWETNRHRARSAVNNFRRA